MNETVLEILKEMPRARESDEFLWLMVLRRRGLTISLKRVEEMVEASEGCKFSSVSRKKRKLKKEYPDPNDIPSYHCPVCWRALEEDTMAAQECDACGWMGYQPRPGD